MRRARRRRISSTAENAYTARYMEQARIRPQIADDLDQLEHVTSWTLPIARGDDLFFMKLLAGEDQASIYVRHGWAEKDKRLVDPAQFSRDPNTSIESATMCRATERWWRTRYARAARTKPRCTYST